jgi:hypothetical protein
MKVCTSNIFFTQHFIVGIFFFIFICSFLLGPAPIVATALLLLLLAFRRGFRFPAAIRIGGGRSLPGLRVLGRDEAGRLDVRNTAVLANLKLFVLENSFLKSKLF